MLTNLDAAANLGGAVDGVVHIACEICADGGALHGSSSLAELSRANLLRAETVLRCGPKCGAKAGRGMRLEAECDAVHDALKRAPAVVTWTFRFVSASAACSTSCVIVERACSCATTERSTS